jgi:hypothetical protein
MTRAEILAACESRTARDRIDLAAWALSERIRKARDHRLILEMLARVDPKKRARRAKFMHSVGGPVPVPATKRKAPALSGQLPRGRSRSQHATPKEKP